MFIDLFPKIELFKLPRYNILTDLVSHERQEEIDWPDYQGRIFKNIPDRVMWHKPVHERIYGHQSYIYLPAKKEISLIHSKTRQQHLLRLAQYFAIKNQGNADLW